MLKILLADFVKSIVLFFQHFLKVSTTLTRWQYKTLFVFDRKIILVKYLYLVGAMATQMVVQLPTLAEALASEGQASEAHAQASEALASEALASEAHASEALASEALAPEALASEAQASEALASEAISKSFKNKIC